MLLLRPGELRFAEWSEIDLDGALWTVPAVRMKRELRQKLNGTPHLVPLPRQAVAVFRELQALTGQGKMVFRGERHHDRAMSKNTVNAALRAMGFSADEVTGHGFRATARTMLHERLGFDPDVIEAQLAHSVRDSLGRPTTGPSSSSSGERCCRRGRTTWTGCGEARRSSRFGGESPEPQAEIGPIAGDARLGGYATARVSAPTSAFVGLTLIWMS